ncbi:hypothetical protein M409DRAFT_36984 [Zasmidium cellare ATCC 36951]|uniref:Sensitive to high expression protein 9, mitochondrial n=1 Tax=Zasmidium cellare ATCC 36951 TaxID=1080233 RepID=A0A6A6CDN1_ZASCE|nr:uncharacterized protein M409DRAFT_36984 [Zasmidium cellare ATCC 36951]KAF2164823.1 hypothetical protein M409DRAFT_36984 [Zasmidium cellare ATCC 36951]
MSVARRPTARIGAELIRWSLPTKSQASYSSLTKPWTCAQCRGKQDSKKTRVEYESGLRKHFSQTLRRQDGGPESRKAINPSSEEAQTPASSSNTLPSHTANQRSQLSNRASKVLDTLLLRASIAGQHINVYTGTDYSGIEALRKEITEQEQKVRELHAAVDKAKEEHHEAHAKQTSAQREIVALLERKSSWSPTDLERYMSLVRSEHMNDMDVQQAKDNLTAAERSLEDARSLMEKLERKQYHEEQVWSDTIRRNSTWVTFGLMGVNILLLLAQIAIFEPYRRKKIVRDVKAALDEKTMTVVPSGAEAERQIDAVVPPREVSVEAEKDDKTLLDSLLPPKEDVGGTPLAAGEMLPSEAADFAGAIPVTKSNVEQAPSEKGASKSTLEAYQEALQDLFSERIVRLRKVDVTNTALQGAATGVAVMGLLFVLLRPR